MIGNGQPDVGLQFGLMFWRDRGRGGGRSRGTENASPIAWVRVGYGSWPRITARTESKGVARRAANTRSGVGRVFCRAATKSAIGVRRSGVAAEPRAATQSVGIDPRTASLR